jgi:hypothetical protein
VTEFSKTFPVFYKGPDPTDVQVALTSTVCIEVLNVKVHMFVLLLFASLPDCSQNQTAVSDTLRLLSDF